MIQKKLSCLVFFTFLFITGSSALAFSPGETDAAPSLKSPYKSIFIGQLYAQNDTAAEDDPLDESEDPLAEEDPLDESEDPLAEDDPLDESEDPLAEDDPLDESEDPLAEEDPLSDDEDDVEVADSDEAAVSDDDSETEEVESVPIRTTFSNHYRLIAGYSETEKGGVGKEEEGNRERKNQLANAYQLSVRIQTSPLHFYQFRTLSRFSQKYDQENQQYTDDFEFEIREGYYRGISGNHRYTIGAQLLRLGKVDYDSPIDILSPSSSAASDIMDLDESKLPVIGLKYDWLGEIHTFSIYIAPFKQKTGGTEYTIFQEEEEEKETGQIPPDRSVTRPHFGVQYQTSFEQVDLRMGLFHWFDPDNNISWQETADAVADDPDTETTEETDEETTEETTTDAGDQADSSSLDQTYTEKDTSISFAAVELDVTLGSFVLKSDIALFEKKNFYHYYKKPDSSSNFYTVDVPHFAFAVSLEKKFETIFVMPVYSYRLLMDVPENTHIFTFENEVAPLEEKRNIHRHQLSLILLNEFSETLNTVITIAQTTPFEQQSITNLWAWTPGGGDHKFSLKLFYSQTEKLKMTGKAIKNSKAFVEYNYQF
jgi:hypothetical protein